MHNNWCYVSFFENCSHLIGTYSSNVSVCNEFYVSRVSFTTGTKGVNERQELEEPKDEVQYLPLWIIQSYPRSVSFLPGMKISDHA